MVFGRAYKTKVQGVGEPSFHKKGLKWYSLQDNQNLQTVHACNL